MMLSSCKHSTRGFALFRGRGELLANGLIGWGRSVELKASLRRAISGWEKIGQKIGNALHFGPFSLSFCQFFPFSAFGPFFILYQAD